MSEGKYRANLILVLMFILSFLSGNKSECQQRGVYPPFTKWYQDPLGLKPLELSTAFGFVWGSAAVATSLILTKKDTTFQKQVSIYCETGLGTGYKWPYTLSLQNEMGIMYDVRKWMSIGIGWTTFHFNDEVNNTWSFGIRPYTRWYPYRGKNLSVYFEYGAGICYSLKQFPLTGTEWGVDTGRTGTRFNLNSKYSVGAVFYFKNYLSFQLSIRHFHLSNGNIEGIKRNPSHDSNGLFIGVVYKLNRKKN